MAGVRAVPEFFHTVNMYLVVPNAREAMAFYEKAFSATSVFTMTGPGDSVMHAELRIGDSTVMLSDENPQWEMKSALTLGGSPVSMHLYVEDVDAVFAQAIESGCKEVAPLMDAFWGDRFGKVVDPFGFQWGIATHVEDVEPEEMERRQKEWMASMSEGGC